MHCKNCGTRVDDNVAICSKCGNIIDKKQLMINENTAQLNDTGSVLYYILGLFFPFAGFILYFAWIKKRKVSAKQALCGAIISLVTLLVAACSYLIIMEIISEKSYEVTKILLDIKKGMF